MMKCTELAKFGERSVVEIRDTETDKVKKYVVCHNFDNSKAYGSKWDTGTYFDIAYRFSQEEQLKAAIMFLYGVEEHKISYERMEEFARDFLGELTLDADDDFAEHLREDMNMTEAEAEYFEIKDQLFPKKFKVVECKMIRTQEVKIKVVMPNDEDECYVENYIENESYLENDYSLETTDWEVDSYSVDADDLSEDDVKSNYDSDDIWNFEDFDNYRI